ncbi:uncharacterized protein LOC129544724 [Moschus berezovskii]|uniref:uncharacterized protein LOC129544724 n=1 Tax=Moschus berezovskii TaxID=68408 RepID=UPI00244442D5|nr:uncharacterized protein LOC129544724 [Moschus berezovskii]
MVSSRKQSPGETLSGSSRCLVLDLLGHFPSTEVFPPQPQGGLKGGRELSCPRPDSFAPASPRGSVLTASCGSNSGSRSDAQARNEVPGGPQPPVSSGTRPGVPSQPHLGRSIHMQSVDGCWLSSALVLMSGSWSPSQEGVWSVVGIPRGFLSGALPSPSPVPRFLSCWKALLQFSHLSALSPPLGCAAINNSQVPPPRLPAALTEERAVVGGWRGSMLECQGSGELPPVGPLTSPSDTGPRKGVGAVRGQVLLDADSCPRGCRLTAAISCPASLVGASRTLGCLSPSAHPVVPPLLNGPSP